MKLLEARERQVSREIDKAQYSKLLAQVRWRIVRGGDERAIGERNMHKTQQAAWNHVLYRQMWQ